MTKFEILFGDITKIKFDAIVNAANASLLGGGGVDGTIHKACGNELLEECRHLNGCMTGKSKITKSYNLYSSGVYWVIHTVGPIYRNNGAEEKYLRSAYRSVFDIAANYSACYLKQCNEILDKNLYRFNSSRQKEHFVKEFEDYIEKHPIKTLALPSISTGAYSYPLREACNIALDEILTFIENSPETFDKIAMVCFDEKTFNMYESLYKERLQTA
ncbi:MULTISPECIES: macro domain-containing protein [unclassified Clostridium]|uniref:macro domain-containing protein n=1 Tax=unclassified Clostridium TaxID=2614128 RepID=UPI00029793F5|nr:MULTISPECIES: macro domain-containing protein [unclassified Clostridium]EKQ53046.1 MAG: putative phosphatase, C-terminal domain of histone macro H2A1 like protein [Clostridium sp. Maddingley MBC34-26]